MIEPLFVAWVAAVGVALLLGASRSISPWGAAAMSPIIGTALFTVVGLLLASARAYSVPRAVLFVSIGAALAGAAALLRTPSTVRWVVTALGASLVFTMTVSVFALSFPTTRVSTDSFHYLYSAASLVRSGSLEGLSDFYTATRLLVTPLIQTLAVEDRGYTAIWTPLLAISMILTLGWLASTGLRMIGVTRKWEWLILVPTFAFLLTTNRVLYQISYINGHMLFAGFLLVGVGLGWRAVCTGQWELLMPVALVFAASVPIRAESVIVVSLFLIPFLAFGAVPIKWRWVILLPTVAATLVWDAWMLPNELSSLSLELLKGPIGNVAIAIGMTILVGLSAVNGIQRYVRWVPWMSIAAVCAVLGFFAWQDSAILLDSVVAMASGIALEWHWGVFWIAVPLLFMGSLVVGFRNDQYFSIGLVGFAIALPVFAYLRGIAFVATRGDSANRMLMHVAPLFVLAIVLATGTAVVAMTGGTGAVRRSHALNQR